MNVYNGYITEKTFLVITSINTSFLSWLSQNIGERYRDEPKFSDADSAVRLRDAYWGFIVKKISFLLLKFYEYEEKDILTMGRKMKEKINRFLWKLDAVAKINWLFPTV